MKIIDLMERYRAFLIVALVLVSSIAVIVISNTGMITYDGFWHLRMGKDWVEEGLSPRIDHYSFTYEGEPISSPPYLFQLLLYSIVETFGLDNGFSAYKIIAGLAVLGTATVWLIIVKCPTPVAVVFYPVIVGLLQTRSMVRPELISYSFMLVTMILMYKARDQYNARTMVPALLLMVLWGFYHNSIVGYVILFGFFTDSAVNYLRERVDRSAWTAWFLWGLLICLAGFLNPDLSHPIIRRLTWDSGWVKLIREYDPSIVYSGRSIVYLLIGIASLCIGLLVKQRRIGLLVVVILLVYSALLYSRMVAQVGIIISCLLVMLLGEGKFDNWIAKATNQTKYVLGGVCAIVISLLVFDIASITQARFSNDSSRNYPHDVVEYMQKQQFNGRVLNKYGVGGFLIFHLAPDIKVFVDGRTNILYPIEHLDLYFTLLDSPTLVRRYAQEMGVEFVINGNNSNFYDSMFNSGLYELEYAGQSFSLFRTSDAKFPLIGTLAARPACWEILPRERVVEEMFAARESFPENSALVDFLNLIQDYHQAPDQAEFISSFKIPAKFWNWNRRFLGYRAIEHGNYQKAYELFALADTTNQRDVLAASWALQLNGESEIAESTLHKATLVKWNTLSPSDLLAMYNLINLVSPKDESDSKFKSFQENLEIELKRLLPSGDFPPLSMRLFCGLYE